MQMSVCVIQGQQSPYLQRIQKRRFTKGECGPSTMKQRRTDAVMQMKLDLKGYCLISYGSSGLITLNLHNT